MKLINKIILLIIIVIISYVLYYFYKKQLANKQTIKEGYQQATEADNQNITNEITNIKIPVDDKYKMPTGVDSLLSSDMSMHQYCIKGSCNSAYSGSYISEEMLEYVINRGCRFLHFQVFPDDGEIVVGYTSDKSTSSSQSATTVLLNDILQKIKNKGFDSATPSNKDPVFVYLDVHGTKNEKSTAYRQINDFITSNKNSSVYGKKINANTSIQLFKGKIVFIFNEEPVLSAVTNKCYLTVNGNINKNYYAEIDPSKYKAKPPKIVGKNKTNKTVIDILMPTNNKEEQKNPNIFNAISKYGINVCLMQYYNNDNYLLNNEIMFKHYGTGIVPLATLIEYTKTYGLEKDEDIEKNVVFPSLLQ